VIEWLPRASAAVASAAEPAESGALPSDVAPSKNCTVPVAADGVTVAVIVTLCPTTEGFGDVVTAVDELALVTLCVRTADVLPVKLALPE
jgi:hypothetical protein